MTRIVQTTYSEGLFHGLPTFPGHDGKKYTAIVTGANVITGSVIVDVLAAAPERWETVYAMSRKPPQSKNPRVKAIAADFLQSSPEELAAIFEKEDVKADFIFFASYLQPPAPEGAAIWSNADALDTINATLLNNFLTALTISSIIPKRQTGGKHYAVHLGPTKTPMTEGTPADRVTIESNFYFPQEDMLAEWAAKHNTKWTVTRPAFIIGANEYAQINVAYALALYASIQRALGLKLEFPADISAWDASKDLTYAKLIGYFSEWVVLTPATANEALNIVDDSPFAYGHFWPELAKWYGIEQGIPEVDDDKFTVVTMPHSPPPRGFGPAGKVYVKFSFEAWAQKPEVKAAWEKLQEEQGLNKAADPWISHARLMETFGVLDAEMLGGWTRTMTMDKAKKMGWRGHVQSDEGIRDTIEKMVELKMVPKI